VPYKIGVFADELGGDLRPRADRRPAPANAIHAPEASFINEHDAQASPAPPDRGSAHRALRQVGKAGVPLRRPMLGCVPGKKPRRPQFMRIAQFLRLSTSQRRQPCLGFDGDRWLLTGARAIIQRSYRTFAPRNPEPSGDAVKCPALRKRRRVFPIRGGTPDATLLRLSFRSVQTSNPAWL
jgi:hypothetical protein